MFGRPLYCVSLNDDMLLYPCDTLSSPSPTTKCHSSRIHCISLSRCFIGFYCSLSLLDHRQLLLDLSFQLLFQSFICGRPFPSSPCTPSLTRFLLQVPHTKAQSAILISVIFTCSWFYANSRIDKKPETCTTRNNTTITLDDPLKKLR